LVEQRTENPCVSGSIPLITTASVEEVSGSSFWKMNLNQISYVSEDDLAEGEIKFT
jgi:hypothetical protein